MNILIINQPLGNRGDESAHRALVRAINKTYPDAHVTILNFLDCIDAGKDFIVDNQQNTYIKFSFSHDLKSRFTSEFITKIGIVRLGTLLHPVLRKIIPYYKNADFVLCAPGGICMGGFQNWQHLYLLELARIYKKSLVYYSRSFGPFPTKSFSNRRFKKISLRMLQYFDFLSIRDTKTMSLADSMKINYIPSIDTAFLETPNVKIPTEIETNLSSKYVVFVPNSLTWHYAFKHVNQEKIDGFYLEIIKILRKKYSEHQIVMLPQLCSCGAFGDFSYFKIIEKLASDENIFVIPDTYSSDIQQVIIRNSDFIVGSRYHTIVFAINNKVPFVALNYEHKISGLLENLGLSEKMVDIVGIFGSELKQKEALENFENLILTTTADEEACKKAHYIAENCFEKFIQKYMVQ